MSPTPAAKAKSPISRRAILALAALLVLALAGCGSSGNSSSSSTPAAPAETTAASTPATSTPATTPAASGSTTALSLAANAEGQLKYNTNSLSAKAGTVTIDFTNMAPLAHNVTVATASGTVVGATPTFQGGSKTLTLSLKPGVYTFYCSVPGHRMAGMEGKITVK